MTGSLDPTEHHIESYLKVTPPKGPNLHKFKMAAMSEFNVQQTFFWVVLGPINVLPTDRNVISIYQIRLLPSRYDDRHFVPCYCNSL